MALEKGVCFTGSMRLRYCNVAGTTVETRDRHRRSKGLEKYFLSSDSRGQKDGFERMKGGRRLYSLIVSRNKAEGV